MPTNTFVQIWVARTGRFGAMSLADAQRMGVYRAAADCLACPGHVSWTCPYAIATEYSLDGGMTWVEDTDDYCGAIDLPDCPTMRAIMSGKMTYDDVAAAWGLPLENDDVALDDDVALARCKASPAWQQANK